MEHEKQQNVNSRLPSKMLLWTLVPIVALFISCNVPLGELFSPYQCVTRHAQSIDVVGVWVPDQATRDDTHIRGRYPASVQLHLHLKEDGKFEMMEMPDWWMDGFGDSHGGYKSGGG